METVKIIHLLPSNHFSGAEHVILQIMDLFKNDPCYEMWYVSCEGPIQQVLEKRAVRYKLLPAFSYGEVKKVVNELQPDIIHAHDVRAGVMAALFGKKMDVLSQIHVNWPWMKRLNIKTFFYALALKRIKQVLGVSQSVCDEYKFRRILKDKFAVLPNVIDEKEIRQKAEEFAIKEPIDLLFVGRLIAPKNPLLFLEIVKALVTQGRRVRAVMLGDGELRQACENYIAANHLENCVSLEGFVSNPYPYMKGAKLLVIPSTFEGFGLVAVEAMLLGTPVIGSPVGGLKDILIRTESPIARTKDEFISNITRLLNQPEASARQVQAAQKHLSSYVDLKHYKDQLAQYYRQAAEGKNGK